MDSPDARTSFPELPLELVLVIVEKLLEVAPKRASELLLLSRNIKPIAEKALYRAIVLESERAAGLFVKMLESGCRPDSFYRTNVRALCIIEALQISILTSLFSACPRAQTIGIFSWNNWDDPTTNGLEVDKLLDAFMASNGPQPSRLSVDWRWCRHRFHLPLFQNVSHLQFYATSNSRFTDFEAGELSPLTKLTHLSVTLVDPWVDAMPEFISNLSETLGDSIQVCIVYIYADYDSATLESFRSKDPRVVFAVHPGDMVSLVGAENILLRDLLDKAAFVRQWGEKLDEDEMDIWEEAEELVAVQRALPAAEAH
ncbi:hypothetical protein C8J56DRAFT_950086 [Mycena floridula]|nr:hypothetical protein C8J56DRAFT_950086 [Mycena floridula]